MLKTVVTALALAAAAPSAAVTYNAFDDFWSGASAPVGNPWSYGAGNGGASFAALTDTTPCYIPDLACHSGGSVYTRVGKYVGTDVVAASNQVGVFFGGNALFMHPGQYGGQSAIVRFTAQAAGTYALTGAFTAIDYGYGNGVNLGVLLNGGVVQTGFYAGGSASANGPGGGLVTFTPQSFELQAGDTLDFVVDNAGNYAVDSTGLVANLEFTAPVPEPGEWAMIAAGLAIVGATARRRRAQAGKR